MRLLVVSQYFWPEGFRVNDLVGALAARGHQVTVLTGVPNYPDGQVFAEYRESPERFSEYAGIPVVRVPLLPRGRGALRLVLNYASFVVAASTIGTWRLRGQEFDAVFVYQPSPVTACIPALAIGRVKGAPVLLWTLDLWPETLEALGVVRSKVALSLVSRMVTAIYRGCALVLGQSRGFGASVERHVGSRARFRYFPQWSEPLFEGDAGAGEPAPEVRPFASTFNVMFAGNIGDAQDFPAILDAAERLRHRADVRWLVVGDGRAAPWVSSEIARRGLGDRVILLGRHPLERMPSFFRGAGALLVTLRRDPVFALTIPGKVQTYLASGLPLVAMLDGEGARVVEESGAGLTCAAGDSEALAANVVRLAESTAGERAAMGQRGLGYSAQEFDRDHLISQLEGWLTECTAAPPPAGRA